MDGRPSFDLSKKIGPNFKNNQSHLRPPRAFSLSFPLGASAHVSVPPSVSCLTRSIRPFSRHFEFCRPVSLRLKTGPDGHLPLLQIDFHALLVLCQ